MNKQLIFSNLRLHEMVGFIKKWPVFLFLLPVFFVLHGSVENFDLIPTGDATLLILFYEGVAFLFLGLCWLYYKNFIKSALLAFIILAYQFFFGSLQDILKINFPGSFFSRYSFLLPCSLIFFFMIVIRLKKRKRSLERLLFYLNLLLLISIATDILLIAGKTIFLKKNNPLVTHANEKFIPCDSCAKPDIYFIIADEYAGNEALKKILNFDNTPFLNELKTRGFHISEQSRSNYYSTRLSVASMLNMNYLDIRPAMTENEKIRYSYSITKNSRLPEFLKRSGYRFYNYSIFDFAGEPSPVNQSFLPNKTQLITAQTFTNRLIKDIRTDVASGKLPYKSILRNFIYINLRNNEKVLRLTHETAAASAGEPKFVYTHLLMPHYPYYFDSSGKNFPTDSLMKGSESDPGRYIQYLVYCNKQILKLIDDILANSVSRPIIILIGDHGFRHYKTTTPEKYYFMNLNAIYLPDGDYHLFYQDMTTVNLFRMILDAQFRQHLPLIKDSTVSLVK